MKYLVFEFRNEWRQLIGKWNWYTFTPIHLSFEWEWHGLNTEFILLGLGFYFRINTQKSLDQFDSWEKEI